jgi:hypothetical protein
VFKRIVGPDFPNVIDGIELLGDTTFVADDPDPWNRMACGGTNIAEIRHGGTAHPKVIMCDPALEYGSIGHEDEWPDHPESLAKAIARCRPWNTSCFQCFEWPKCCDAGFRFFS